MIFPVPRALLASPAAWVLVCVPRWAQRAACLFSCQHVHFNFVRRQRIWRHDLFSKGFYSFPNYQPQICGKRKEKDRTVIKELHVVCVLTRVSSVAFFCSLFVMALEAGGTSLPWIYQPCPALHIQKTVLEGKVGAKYLWLHPIKQSIPQKQSQQ